MDGMGAWDWNDTTVRLLVNHELPPDKAYLWKLTNGTELRGARISWFDIDKASREVRAAGNAIKEIRDRRGEIVTKPEQVHEHWDTPSDKGLNVLCSAQGYAAGEFGFRDNLLFTHEEVCAVEDHPHGGSVWALDVDKGRLWALPALGRGSWENVTAVATPDQDAADGHIALLMSDDHEFGGAPLYMWIGQKDPDGDFPSRNGLRKGQLYAWVCDNEDRNPQDWHGTGTKRSGVFYPVPTRFWNMAGEQGYDRDGWSNDTVLRNQALKRGAFMFSRPEDLHTNPKNASQVALCSTGHGIKCPADEWGTIYLIDVSLDELPVDPSQGEQYPRADITILHDCDDFGDKGIRSSDNIVWASDGMLYIHEDKANRRDVFGGETGREASTWRLNPADSDDREVVAVIDRSVVLPEDAEDMQTNNIGAWECCGLIDVSSLFAAKDELLFITAVQAHSVRGGSLGDDLDLFQGGQLVMLSRPA
jgi:secreted PhoX family phosphatase